MEIANEKSLINSNSIKRLISFIENIEEKLSSVEKIHQKFHEFIQIICKTHQTIEEELENIKQILNEQISNKDQFVPIDSNQCQCNEQIHSMKMFECETNMNSIDEQTNILSSDQLSLSSSSSSSLSMNSLNNNQRIVSSNLKKSPQSSVRVKSSKSVSFSFDENLPQLQLTIEPKKESSKEKFNRKCDLITNLFEEHHYQVRKKEDFSLKLGNALTNIRIHEIESINGDYLRLLNISNSDDYDLGGHFLQQNLASVPLSRFRFPLNTIIRAGQTVTIFCGSLKDIQPQPPHIFLWKEQKRWQTGPESLTVLAKPTGQAIAWTRSTNHLNSDQSSSDILYIHSRSHRRINDDRNSKANSLKSVSRLSGFELIGNNQSPFVHSSMKEKSGISQLLNRPKSSPFANHKGCKQDLISLNFLRTDQNKDQKEKIIQR